MASSSVRDAPASPLANVTSCIVCSQPARFTCSACGDAGPHFCSPACQTQNWDVHKFVCKGAQPARPRSPRHSPGTVVPEVVIETNDTTAPRAVEPPESTAGRSRARRRRVQGRGNAAQVINSETHLIDRIRRYLPFQSQAPADSSVVIPERVDSANLNNEPELTEEEKIEDLKYYMEQIFLIIKPVIACMALSILWVKLTTESTPLYDSGIATQIAAPTTSVGTSLGFSSSSSGSAFVSAAGILGEIVGATLVIVALFYFNCMKILYALFVLIVTGLLGVFTWTLGNELLTVHNLAFDKITFWFFIWNVTIVGVTQIFYKGPMILQQCYLVFMSSLMAHSLTKLPSLTTWILLALLAIWDLIAVLCPFGPLRILVETAQTHDREIPAMLYSVMVWMMASPGDPPSVRAQPASSSASITRRGSAARSDTSSWHALQSDFGDASQLIKGHVPPVTEIEMNVRTPAPGSAAPESAPLESDPLNAPAATPPANGDDDTGDAAEEAEEEEAARGGVKLGLGDFVFYSVLVGRAALFDWVTTFACSIAVLTGLNATIFLLAMYQKALPALPISIAFGILFYFVSAVTLSPLVNFLVKRPDKVVVAGAEAWLWVGQGGGGGMVYV